MIISITRWLSVSLSVLLSVALFYSIAGGVLWGVVFGLVGFVLSIAQFYLPLHIRAYIKNSNPAAVVGCSTLLLCLQIVSLAASVGGLGGSLDSVRGNIDNLETRRALIVKQIEQEQKRVDVLVSFDRASKAAPIQENITALRAELSALPDVANARAVSLVDTLANVAGVDAKTAASSIYIVVSVLLDAVAVFFLLAGTTNSGFLPLSPQPVTLELDTVQATRPKQGQLFEIETPYTAIVSGVCRLSVRAIRQHYGIGTEKAYKILDDLTAAGLVEKDSQTNRYRLTEKAGV